jgi:hypothetical protein
MSTKQKGANMLKYKTLSLQGLQERCTSTSLINFLAASIQFLFDWVSEFTSKSLIFSNILFDSNSESWTKTKHWKYNLVALKAIFSQGLGGENPYPPIFQSTNSKILKYNLDDLKSVFRRNLDARESYLIGYQSAKMELKNFNLDGL